MQFDSQLLCCCDSKSHKVCVCCTAFIGVSAELWSTVINLISRSVHVKCYRRRLVDSLNLLLFFYGFISLTSQTLVLVGVTLLNPLLHNTRCFLFTFRSLLWDSVTAQSSFAVTNWWGCFNLINQWRVRVCLTAFIWLEVNLISLVCVFVFSGTRSWLSSSCPALCRPNARRTSTVRTLAPCSASRACTPSTLCSADDASNTTASSTVSTQ